MHKKEKQNRLGLQKKKKKPWFFLTNGYTYVLLLIPYFTPLRQLIIDHELLQFCYNCYISVNLRVTKGYKAFNGITKGYIVSFIVTFRDPLKKIPS